MNEYMNLACKEALKGMNTKDGGPFGAVVVKNNEIVSLGHNMVLVNNDPTAHAEITAIRYACQKLNTYDLKGCTIYTSSEPCPMCMSAIIWANIKDVYYGTDRVAVGNIGFRDKFIYDYLAGREIGDIKKIQIDGDSCQEILNKYSNTIY